MTSANTLGRVVANVLAQKQGQQWDSIEWARDWVVEWRMRVKFMENVTDHFKPFGFHPRVKW